MRDGLAVAAHRGLAAIPEGGFCLVVGEGGPIPVGLGAGVIALGLKRELVLADEDAVPWEEKPLLGISKACNYESSLM